MGSCLKKRMPENQSLGTTEKDFILNQTNYSLPEIRKMYEYFIAEHPSGKLKLKDLIKFYKEFYPDGDPEVFAQAMFKTFDTNNDGLIDFKEFTMGLSLFNKGPLVDKLKWVFKLYDDDNSGSITKDEMLYFYQIVSKMIPQDITTPQAKADYAFELVDVNGDGEISLEEFVEVVRKNPMLIHPIPV